MIIKNGRVIDPESGFDRVCDIEIKDNIIINISDNIEVSNNQEVIDATNKYVMPGFIDLHVHLRDPGLTYKEDIETGTMAAAAGGVTTICAMPNTKPAVDNVKTLEYVFNKAKEVGKVRVEQLSAVTLGQDGNTLVDIKENVKAGAIAFSEDGKSVMDITLYKEALKQVANAGSLMMAHCEDKDLVNGGVLNEGVASLKYNVPGITNSVEDVITARDIFLAHEAGCKLHLCHVSTKGAVELIRMAKQMGIDVTGEVCPHHFTLTDSDITENDSNYKMNPPLRSEEDVKALIKGIIDGTMEVISTDHAPHSEEEKEKDFLSAPFGIVGLETSAALTYTALVKPGLITIMDMARLMSLNPAKVIGLDNERGKLQPKMQADIVIFDPEKEWVVDASQFASKGKNTPYNGKELLGKVITTIVAGKVVYKE